MKRSIDAGENGEPIQNSIGIIFFLSFFLFFFLFLFETELKEKPMLQQKLGTD